MQTLSPEEIRVLGCLMEKERTTPEYYPMTLNSLVTACNQKTSRDPVVDYDDEIVEHALESLNARGLANWVHQAGARVKKFRHSAEREFELYEPGEMAVFTVLLLRGAQTLGELRQRTERIYAFPTLDHVEEVIREFMNRDEPLVTEGPRVPGKKEIRYLHLLGDIPTPATPQETLDGEAPPAAPPSLTAAWDQALKEAIAPLKQEIGELKVELDQLKIEFEAFKTQFD